MLIFLCILPPDFTQFLRAIQMQRDIEKRQDREADFLAAFVAMVCHLRLRPLTRLIH
jgi:hypothetical protein